MNRDTRKGRWQQLKGRLRQAFGGATGDRSEQAKGGIQEVGGKIREGFGHADEEITREPRNT